MCGGTHFSPLRTTPLRGLSPRVRGNLVLAAGKLAYTRSIPACAGEPRSHRCLPYSPRVYPRVCGGTVARIEVKKFRHGLSPRVRGNLERAAGGHCRPRSIPACAGEPPTRSSCCLPPQVYPRVCGGTVGLIIAGVLVQGLSPRVRGNPGFPYDRHELVGSIPACAGEPGLSV